jgi:Fic family protein
LYFVSIHPFEDGNGRVARGISEKILAKRTDPPQLSSLSATVLVHRLEYYKMLERANKSNEVTLWLRWFAGIAIESQERTQKQIDFVIQKSSLVRSISDALNARQSKVLMRMCREGFSGFAGGLSAGNYVAIAKTSPATARRDLAELVEMNALTRTGIKRHTRYQLAIPQRKIPRIIIDDDGEVIDS